MKILRQILNGFHWDPVTLFLIWNDNIIATRSRSHDQELLWGSLYIFLEFYYTDPNTWDTLKSQTYCKKKCAHVSIYDKQSEAYIYLQPQLTYFTNMDFWLADYNTHWQ